MGVNSLPKTVTRQRRDCDLNPGPSALESSTLTTRLPSHWHMAGEKSVTTSEIHSAEAMVHRKPRLFQHIRRPKNPTERAEDVLKVAQKLRVIKQSQLATSRERFLSIVLCIQMIIKMISRVINHAISVKPLTKISVDYFSCFSMTFVIHLRHIL